GLVFTARWNSVTSSPIAGGTPVDYPINAHTVAFDDSHLVAIGDAGLYLLDPTNLSAPPVILLASDQLRSVVAIRGTNVFVVERGSTTGRFQILRVPIGGGRPTMIAKGFGDGPNLLRVEGDQVLAVGT